MAFEFKDLGTVVGPEGGRGPQQAGAAAFCFRWTFRSWWWGWWTCWWGPWWRCCGWWTFITAPIPLPCVAVSLPDIRRGLLDPQEIATLRDQLRRELAELEKLEQIAKKGPKAQIQMIQDELLDEAKRLEELKKQVEQEAKPRRGGRGKRG